MCTYSGYDWTMQIGNPYGQTNQSDLSARTASFREPCEAVTNLLCNNVYVIDSNRKCVKKLSRDGKVSNKFPARSDGNDRYIYGLAWNNRNGLVSTHRWKTEAGWGNEVVIQHNTGEYVTTFTHPEFRCIFGVAVNNQGDILVTDLEARAVFKFNFPNYNSSQKLSVYGEHIRADDGGFLLLNCEDHTLYRLDMNGSVKQQISFGSCVSCEPRPLDPAPGSA